MRKRIIVILILGAVAVAAVSRLRWPEPLVPGFDPGKNVLSKDVRKILEKGDRFILLSLDPGAHPAASDTLSTDTFYNFSVLGQTEIRTRKERRELLHALYKGIADSRGWALACFNPRHGIRATLDGNTVDLVICFECGSIQVHGKSAGGVLTTGSAGPTFNLALQKAGLPIAKSTH